MTQPFLTRIDWAGLDSAARLAVLQRPALRMEPEIASKVGAIIGEVRTQGDAALLRLTATLDGVTLAELRVSEQEFAEASRKIGPEAMAAIEVAMANVSRFHADQITPPLKVETAPGVLCERVSRPIRAVGLYVPAGSAPLPSTAIMLAVPSRIAGCPLRIMCTPPARDGCADPAVVAVAAACGIKDVFKIGGAQAVAAMAYGTRTVPKVDKIFGPGNAWVTAAKQAVAQDPAGAALDMPAGPSEVMVLAERGADPRFVALDLLSQAEHGPDSQAILITTDAPFITAVETEIAAVLPRLPRADIIRQSLVHAAALVARNLDEAIDIANAYAPEHLILQLDEPRRWADRVQTAGSVFLGPWTPESVGDYCSGTNHVLPTYGYARAYSGLSVTDFQRRMTLQELTPGGLAQLAPTVEILAGIEGLDAHAEAVRARVQRIRER
jgi:histidinol dehydrogenase